MRIRGTSAMAEVVPLARSRADATAPSPVEHSDTFSAGASHQISGREDRSSAAVLPWPEHRFPNAEAEAEAADDARGLSANGFARLLERLHADPEEAAQEYERLRRALLKFFDWRGVSPADECADVVLDRLAAKLDATVVQDVRKYAYGIARLVALERQRGPMFAPIEAIPSGSLTANPPAEDGSGMLDCFEHCLGELSEENRSLLLRYYEGERGAKIANRRSLATLLRVTENALRSRVQRLRDRVEQCVRTCSVLTVGQES
jgi:DNA-directed RNA polymerase specialized sigma24 family protein